MALIHIDKVLLECLSQIFHPKIIFMKEYMIHLLHILRQILGSANGLYLPCDLAVHLRLVVVRGDKSRGTIK